MFNGDRASFSAVDGSDAIATLPNALEALEHSEGVGERNEPAGELVRDPCTDDRIELTVAGLELALLGDLTSVLSWDSALLLRTEAERALDALVLCLESRQYSSKSFDLVVMFRGFRSVCHVPTNEPQGEAVDGRTELLR